jgi:hypothetical protein
VGAAATGPACGIVMTVLNVRRCHAHPQSDITFTQLRMLHDVSKKVNSQLDLPILLNEILDLAIGLLHAEKGLILLREEASGEFVVQVGVAFISLISW